MSHAIPFPLSSCCFWAAVLTKETGVSLLGIAAAYEIFLVLPRGGGPGTWASCSGHLAFD